MKAIDDELVHRNRLQCEYSNVVLRFTASAKGFETLVEKNIKVIWSLSGVRETNEYSPAAVETVSSFTPVA